MRRSFVVACAAVVALLLVVAANAITFGENDNGRHPFVGALVGDFQGTTFPICTGTLMSSTVFLTAGHCFEETIPLGATNFGVSFDEVVNGDGSGGVDPGVTVHHGTPHVDPEWNFPSLGGSNFDPHDIAVLVLNEPVSMSQYGQVPTLNLLEDVDKRTARFTAVGYGAVRDDKTKGPASLGSESRRKLSTQDMLSLRKAWVLFSGNPSTGNGGTCFGDSGGPHFLGAGSSETRIVVALTVTGDRYCRATDEDYRVDTPQARAFLDEFLTLP
jgi:trypsin